jgi:capsular polysaccharide transport system ATP-binding protein
MIQVENVSMHYQTRQGRRTVLDDINLTLERGKNVGILGRNGAGKSTLVQLLAGAIQPTSGRIYRGMKVSWPLAFKGAFQANLTGLDNLKFICRIYNVDYEPLIPFVEEFAELGIYFREPVQHYSSGMTARLAFALSMAIDFDCFLIDEILAVGDRRFRERCHAELFVKRKGRSFILVSHQADIVKSVCQSACVLHAGRLYHFNSVNEAFRFYESQPPVLFKAGPAGE